MTRAKDYLTSLASIIALLALSLALKSCGNASDSYLQGSFPPIVPLNANDVFNIINESSLSTDSDNLIIAVVDRVGNPLGVWHRNPNESEVNLNIAVSIARTAGFLSSSQGPITSRTLEFISTSHFPPTFGDLENHEFPNPNIAPRRQTTGVLFTPQGPLWQIFATNRGAFITNEIPPATNIDGTAPGPGLTYLPGGIPLFKSGRVVGAVGCYIPGDIPTSEFAAFSGAFNNGFASTAPNEGAIFLVGILLPNVVFTQGVPNGNPAFLGQYRVDPKPGVAEPDGYLIGPMADPLGNLTLEDVKKIVEQSIDGANRTRAAIRLPIGVTTRMTIAVTNLDGSLLALFRMNDSPIFSVDVSVTKARNVVKFTQNENSELIPFLPPGTAVTNRTLGFLTQPNFPPGIDDSDIEGPLFRSVAVANQNPDNFEDGVVFFPGSTPLYKQGLLVGGLGISGDGVEEDDIVTALGGQSFLPPPEIRADRYSFAGVPLPFLKFPQNP